MHEDIYTATDGSKWYVVNSCPPIPTRVYDWVAWDTEGDGAPDGGCRRANGKTREECEEAVEVLLWEDGLTDVMPKSVKADNDA